MACLLYTRSLSSTYISEVHACWHVCRPQFKHSEAWDGEGSFKEIKCCRCWHEGRMWRECTWEEEGREFLQRQGMQTDWLKLKEEESKHFLFLIEQRVWHHLPVVQTLTLNPGRFDARPWVLMSYFRFIVQHWWRSESVHLTWNRVCARLCVYRLYNASCEEPLPLQRSPVLCCTLDNIPLIRSVIPPLQASTCGPPVRKQSHVFFLMWSSVNQHSQCSFLKTSL